MKSFTLFVAALATRATAIAVTSRPIADSDLADRDLCPRTLPPGSLAPSLIVPISKNLPNIPFGPTGFPTFSPNDVCSIFNFEIPPSYAGKNCTLEFLFPNYLETGAYYYSGPGDFIFTGYNQGSGATPATTYNNQPQPGQYPPFPPLVMKPGNAYTIDIGPCVILNGQTTVVSGKTCTTDTYFGFLQKSYGCPLGVFVAV